MAVGVETDSDTVERSIRPSSSPARTPSPNATVDTSVFWTKVSSHGWTAGLKGEATRIPLIVTGLQVDEHHKKHKEGHVQRFSDAARSWPLASTKAAH